MSFPLNPSGEVDDPKLFKTVFVRLISISGLGEGEGLLEGEGEGLLLELEETIGAARRSRRFLGCLKCLLCVIDSL